MVYRRGTCFPIDLQEPVTSNIPIHFGSFVPTRDIYSNMLKQILFTFFKDPPNMIFCTTSGESACLIEPNQIMLRHQQAPTEQVSQRQWD
jgi:hypothetical protein